MNSTFIPNNQDSNIVVNDIEGMTRKGSFTCKTHHRPNEIHTTVPFINKHAKTALQIDRSNMHLPIIIPVTD